LPQDVAMTGELSITGKIRPVGGIIEKLYAARQAGMRAIIIPRENLREIDPSLSGIEVVAVSHVDEVLDRLKARGPARRSKRPRRRLADVRR